MRLLLTVFLLVSVLFSLGQDTPMLIKRIDVFDGEETHRKMNVLFDQGKIIRISKKKIKDVDAEIIEGEGLTLLPPLLNAHVHVWFPNNLKEALSHGIFAMLDMHSNDFFANTLRKNNNRPGFAHYYSSNAGATVPGGHGTQFGIPVPTINDTLEASQFVKDRVEQHADYIKILKEPRRATLNSQQTKEVIETAHTSNVLAVAHVSTLENALELANQEVDGFVHVWLDKSANEAEWDLLKQADVFMAPTLRVYQEFHKEYDRKGQEYKILTFEGLLMEVKAAHEKGIPILAGTDAPNFNLNYSKDLFEEIILLGQAGLSNEEALKAASGNIYSAFKLKEFRRLAVGSPASFSLVKGNPLKNLEDIRNEKRVFQAGVEIKSP